MSGGLRMVVHQINAAHGTAFVLGERAGMGQHGAYRLEDAHGGAFVLKWEPGDVREPPVGTLPAVARTLDRLRAAGYPIPRYAAWGVLDAPAGRYTVQERLPGRSAWGLSGQALEDALALNDLQADAAAEPWAAAQAGQAGGTTVFEPWRRLLPRLALEGGEGFCLLDAMRAYSPATEARLAYVQEYVAAHAGRLDARPAQDVVHFDFSGPNILVEAGRVSGVVDWGPVPGDRTFDLATLLFYDGYYAEVPATRTRLWTRALELADAQTFGIYLCHMIHRQTDWAIRHHDAETVARVLRLGDAVLADLEERLRQPA